jgi:hypothetical protein
MANNKKDALEVSKNRFSLARVIETEEKIMRWKESVNQQVDSSLDICHWDAGTRDVDFSRHGTFSGFIYSFRHPDQLRKCTL